MSPLALRSHDSPAVGADLRELGFAAVSDLVDPALAAAARRQFFDFLRAQAGFLGVATDAAEAAWAWTTFNDPRVRGKLYELSQGLAACHRLAFDARIARLCAALGLKVPLLRNTTLRIDFPGDDRVLQPAHQDIRGIRSRNCLNFWVPLQRVDEGSGGLRVFPGSHKAGPLMPDDLNAAGYQVIEPSRLAPYPPVVAALDVGAGLIFDPCLVHESARNAGPDVRLTWVFRFDDGAEIDWLLKGSFELAKFDIQATRGGVAT